jgi:hypothetical protein
VVSNDKGQFSFPADRIEPGKYTITIRAAGYDLVGPKTVDVAAGAGAKMDVSSPNRAASRSLPTLNG